MMSVTALSMDCYAAGRFQYCASVGDEDYQADAVDCVRLMIFGMVFGESFFGPLSGCHGPQKKVVFTWH